MILFVMAWRGVAGRDGELVWCGLVWCSIVDIEDNDDGQKTFFISYWNRLLPL